MIYFYQRPHAAHFPVFRIRIFQALGRCNIGAKVKCHYCWVDRFLASFWSGCWGLYDCSGNLTRTPQATLLRKPLLADLGLLGSSKSHHVCDTKPGAYGRGRRWHLLGWLIRDTLFSATVVSWTRPSRWCTSGITIIPDTWRTCDASRGVM